MFDVLKNRSLFHYEKLSVFYVLKVSVKWFWFFIVKNSVKIIPFVIFVCGPEHFPANLIKNVSLKIWLFCHVLSNKMCLDLNQFLPDLSTTENCNCNTALQRCLETAWHTACKSTAEGQFRAGYGFAAVLFADVWTLYVKKYISERCIRFLANLFHR
jgi:hypothetical protein